MRLLATMSKTNVTKMQLLEWQLFIRVDRKEKLALQLQRLAQRCTAMKVLTDEVLANPDIFNKVATPNNYSLYFIYLFYLASPRSKHSGNSIGLCL